MRRNARRGLSRGMATRRSVTGMGEAIRATGGAGIGRRAFWLKHLHRWHWISAALSLAALLLFAATGLTLNHARQIEAQPRVEAREAVLSDALRAELARAGGEAKAPLPIALRAWLTTRLGVQVDARIAEWSDDEVYLSLPRPGGDAWLSIERDSGKLRYERTDRGWIAYLNDLHKGRNAGPVWSWLIDVFAIACLVFALTGFVLLFLHARQRAATWPLVGFGVALMLVVALLFIH